MKILEKHLLLTIEVKNRDPCKMPGADSSWRLTSDKQKADCPSVAESYEVCTTHWLWG